MKFGNDATKTRQYTSARHGGLRSVARRRHAAACVATLLLAAAVLVAGPARGQAEPEAELEAVRERIAALEGRIAGDTRERADGAAALRRLELAIGEQQAAVERLDAEIRDEETREAALMRESRDVLGRLEGEQSLLAEQVRLSFRTGRQEVFRLLLSQEDPAALGRMLTYYDYLNRARGRRIGAARAELDELQRLAAETRETRIALTGLRDERSRELDRLAAARSERATLLARLDRSLAESGAEIERLRGEEARLSELVAELARLLEGFPVESEEPFTSWRGRLAWPVAGRLTDDFGDLREGGPLRWNGVVLAAAAGTPVRAVYHGRVVFADWLPGLGLLIVVDHGDDYMSLYGHNESLLLQPGDWVRPGEVIAEVGDTGGRREPALYFEIRHRGEPEDPHDWIP